jgi:hypothetical protein
LLLSVKHSDDSSTWQVRLLPDREWDNKKSSPSQSDTCIGTGEDSRGATQIRLPGKKKPITNKKPRRDDNGGKSQPHLWGTSTWRLIIPFALITVAAPALVTGHKTFTMQLREPFNAGVCAVISPYTTLWNTVSALTLSLHSLKYSIGLFISK